MAGNPREDQYKRQLQQEIRSKLDQHKDWLQEMREREKVAKEREDGRYYDERGTSSSKKGGYSPQRSRSGDRSTGGGTKRWEQLYELNKLQRETKEFMRKALAEERQDDPECTFHPKISEKSRQKTSHMHPGFIERNNLWMEQKRSKLESRGGVKEDKEQIHCTFTPQLNAYAPKRENDAEVVHLGVQQHLQRLEEARKEKARKEAILAGQSKKTVHDPSKLTIPKNPNLSAFTKQSKRWHKNPAPKPVQNNEEVEQQIEEIVNDPSSLYLTNCSMHEAVMALHDKINSFEITFD